MAFRNNFPRRQQGAVAILFGLTIVSLLATGGVVIDLGHLYIAKTELQNAADAAALAGAKDLNETTAGIDSAILKAKAVGGANKYNFSTALSLVDANLSFGPTPDGPWSDVAAAQTYPQGKTFIKVDTGAKVINTYLMGVAGINTTSTSGVAVAGRFITDVTPLGVCAIDPSTKYAMIQHDLLSNNFNELMEFGFRRGIAYNIPDLGPLGGPGVPILLNPVDVPPVACEPNHSSANFTAPFVCQGNAALSGGVSVYANTGGSYGPIERALNCRLDEYPGGSACDPTSAPPDTNVKSYTIGPPTPGPGSPNDWMDPDPTRQSIRIEPSTNRPILWPLNPIDPLDFGVLWSYFRAVRAAGSAPNYEPGAEFTVADWPTLYSGLAATSYPGPAPYTPYKQTSGNFFRAPSVPHMPGVKDRRVMKFIIADCAGLSSGQLSCATLPVVGIGSFFLQRRTDLTGGNKGIYAEFGGLVRPIPKSEIKLYR